MALNRLLFWFASLDFGKLAGAMLITTFVFWYFILDDGSVLKNDIRRVGAEVNVEREKVKESERAIKESDTVKAQLSSLGDKYGEVTALIPQELPVSDVLRTISTTAALTGVNIKLQEPKPPSQRDILEEMPFKLLLEGTFSEVTMFLYYISTAERIMRVSNFSISLGGGTGQELGTVQFEGDLVAYRFVGKIEK